MRLFLTTALLAAMSVPAAAAINIVVLNNGIEVGSASSASGAADFHSSSIAGYDSISVAADGATSLLNGDLTSTTLDVSASGAAAQTLTVQIFQTGVIARGPTESTFTVNGLVGLPGPTVEQTFFGGTGSTLGTQLASHAFPAGNVVDSFGPVTVGAGAFTSDAQAYTIHFGGGVPMSSNDSIEFRTGAIPEPSTWAMMILGFAGLAYVAARKRGGHDPRAFVG